MSNPHHRYPGPMESEDQKPTKAREGLPLWSMLLAGFTILGLLGFNVVQYGPDGLPTTVVLGGLFGSIFGVDQFLKDRSK